MMFYKGEKVYEVIARSRDGSMMIMTHTVESCGQKRERSVPTAPGA